MDHAQATELFTSYWDEELSPSDAKALEEHLASCVVCRREYQELEKAMGAVGALPKVDAPPDFVKGVVSRVRQRSGGRFFSPKRVADRVPYELFSLVMLGIILAIYLILQMSQPGHVKLP